MSDVRWRWARVSQPETWQGSFATREEAIIEAASHGYKTFYIASGSCPAGSSYMPDASTVLDMLSEAAYDAVGDVAEDFPTVPDEAEQELNALLTAWGERYLGTCPFWIVEGNPEQVVWGSGSG
jgi:hypothetical protein